MSASSRDGVDLVDEDDRGGLLDGPLEGLPELLLAFALVLGDDLRAVDDLEVGVDLVGDGLGDEGLARARRAVQQDAGGRLDTELPEQLRLRERQLYHLADLLEFLVEAADVLVGGVGGRLRRRLVVAGVALRLGCGLSVGDLAQPDGRPAGDADGAVGRRLGDRGPDVEPFEADLLAGLQRPVPEVRGDRIREVLVGDARQFDDHLVGLRDRYLADRHRLADVDAGVGARLGVDADDPLLAARRPDLRDRRPVALDDDRVAAEHPERPPCGLRQSGDAAARIALLRAPDSQRDPPIHGRSRAASGFTVPPPAPEKRI